MLAETEEVDISNDDHFAVTFREYGLIQHGLNLLMVPLCQEFIHLRNPRRRFFQTFPPRILSHVAEQFPDGPFNISRYT